MNRPLIAGVLAACTVCWPAVLLAQTVSTSASAPGQPTPLRLRRDVKGDTKPISINADQLAHWTDPAALLLLLRGNVLVEHDGVRARFQQGIVWIEKKPDGGFRVTVYGEGAVRLDNASESSQGESALLELNTGGSVPFSAPSGKAVNTSMADDPLFLRALAQRNAPPPAAANSATPSKPVSATTPVQQTRYEDKSDDPLLPGPKTPAQPTSGIVPPAVPPLVPSGTVPDPVTVGPNTPPPVPPPTKVAPEPKLPPVIEEPLRRLSISPRSPGGFKTDVSKTAPDGRTTIVLTGGAIITVRNAQGGIGLLDIEADRVVCWLKGVDTSKLLGNNPTASREGEGQEIEFFLSGNVEIRQSGLKDSRLLRADEVYYDVNRNVAIAANAQLDFKLPAQYQITDPVVFRAEEVIQHAENQFELIHADVFSSKLPSDPGLKVYVTHGTIENRVIPRLSPFGLEVTNRKTGQTDEEREMYFKGQNVFFELENVPFFYSPYLAGNLLNPLGPIEEITTGYSRIFGFEFGTTLDMYQLLGIQPYEGTKWRLHFDELGARGPAIGSTFDFGGKDLFGIKNTYEGTLSGYTIYDSGFDVLGGGRSSNYDPPVERGRVLWRENVYDLPEGFTVQSQLSYLSDRNFLEQYYWREFALDVNQETYVYGKQQQDFWAYTGIVEPRFFRPWVTEAERLPEVTGHVIGVSFFDLFTYNAHASAGYYQLRPTQDSEDAGSPPASAQDRYDNTGRFDVMQELDLPFQVGPFKIVPYATLDLAEYTQDLDGQSVGRVWGGGGVRASIPFSHLYPDIESDLFNVNGINHKIVLSANFISAKTNVSHTQLPEIDRLNDDATDQSIRDIRPMEEIFLPGPKGLLLSGYPLYDPQVYAIQNLIMSRVDTLDDIEVLQLDLRQRWQTKRGYPGSEHIIDWMVLDLSIDYFPHSSRDDFNEPFSLFQYDWLWNIGDRTALTSTGWYDPEVGGPREWTVGAYVNRPDRTNFYLGYRYIDPLNSRALTAAVTYIFSPKYAMTASSTYDFGTKEAMSNSLVFTRIGSDIQVSAGISYNALTSSVGVLFEIIPNLVPPNKRPGAVGAAGNGGLLGGH
jgi:hypothetical protein